MAKWGEGDPRWIVEERADATNVNNWHWTEKNATAWSKEKLTSLLSGLVLEDDKYMCEIKELTKIEGEASANNRKSKLFFFYEWEIKAEWKGRQKAGEGRSYKGQIEIPNLSEEHSAEDVDINVSLKDGQEDGYDIKEFLRTKGVKTIRAKLGQYIRDLKQEFSQGMILPRKDGTSPATAATAAAAAAAGKQAQNGLKDKEGTFQVINNPVGSMVRRNEEATGLGVRIDCKSLTDEEEFKCSANDLYRVLTDPQMIRAYTTEDAIVDASKGGRFTLFGGNVTGEFTELVCDKRVAMRWRFKSWPPEHYSAVTLDLTQQDDGTTLKLTQTQIPTNELEKTREGWKNHYWRSIKQCFGYGSSLF